MKTKRRFDKIKRRFVRLKRRFGSLKRRFIFVFCQSLIINQLYKVCMSCFSTLK